MPIIIQKLSKHALTCFISREAKKAVREWLKNRDKYLKTALGRIRRKDKNVKGSRFFPFNLQTAHFIWRNALKKSGNGPQYPKTNYHVLHLHVLRKFFRSKMATLIPIDILEALIGHEGYLTEVYRKYTMELASLCCEDALNKNLLPNPQIYDIKFLSNYYGQYSNV